MNRGRCLLYGRRAVVAIASIVPFLPAALTQAEEAAGLRQADVKIRSVKLGFQGVYKLGFWTPIEIQLASSTDLDDGELQVVVPDGDASPSRYTIPIRQGRAGGPPVGHDDVDSPTEIRTVTGYIKIGRPLGEIQVSLRLADRVLAERRLAIDGEELAPPLPALQPLILTVGDLPIVERSLNEYARAKSRSLKVASTEADHLPREWLGYDGIDVLILNVENAAVAELARYPRRLAALDRWVRSGGRIVLAAGGSVAALRTTLSADGAVHRFLPGRVERMVPLTDTVRFEEFAKTSDTLGGSSSDTTEVWQMPHLVDVRGQVLLRQFDDSEQTAPSRPDDLPLEDAATASRREDAVPLIVRASHGLGEVTFVAGDLDSEALGDWGGTVTLLTRLLPSYLDFAISDNADPLSTRGGYDDLTGQLRASLEDFEQDGVRRIPFWLIAMLAIVYLALIAPVDYWFLRRLRGRMEWTWFTFPSMVLVGCVLVWAVAHWAKGDVLRLNQVEVVDIEVSAGTMRGSSWFTMFSPTTDKYVIDMNLVPPHAASAETSGAAASSEASSKAAAATLLSWQGFPGTALGGMRSRASSTLFDEPYDFAVEIDALQGVPVAVWSTKAFRVRYQRSLPSTANLDVRIEPGASESELTGTVTNQLDVPLQDCVLYYRRWAYLLGDLQPGDAVPLPKQWDPITLRSHLTENVNYDRESRDPMYVLRAMMFYEKLGGRAYTRLKNQYEAYLDLSHLIEEGRPILVGYAERPVANPRISCPSTSDSQSRSEIVYRFIFDKPDNISMNVGRTDPSTSSK